MQKVLLPLALLFIFVPAYSQKPQGVRELNIGRLYGKIVENGTKQPVGYASMTVFIKNSSGQDSLVGGCLTQENGDFNLTGLPMGLLTIKVSFIGLKEVSKTVKISPPNDIEQDLGDLQMATDSQVLGTVEIKAEKSLTQISLEKRVFNVDKNITSTGGTAEDVLKSVPSVTIDVDGNAKLRDRGATIYVDGKPSLMTLTQIPADQIESVEIISNPSAKYEASTTGGILNIVLKKNQKPGYNGVLGLGVGSQGRFNGMLNLHAQAGKFSATGSYNGNSNKNPTTGYAYRTNLNPDRSVLNYFNQNTALTFANSFQMGRVALDYAVNNRNALSLAGTITAGTFNIHSEQNYEILNALRQTEIYGVRQTLPRNNFQNNNIEGQWKKTFSQKDKSLSILTSYGWGSSSNQAFWTTTGFDNTGQVLPDYPELVDINGANGSQQSIFQIDYVNPINDSTRVEMGARSFWSGRDQQYFYRPFNYDKNAYFQDNTFSQDSRITENIHAAYLTYSSRWKYAISYQIGLRFEQSNLTGKSKLDGMADFGYDYPKGTGKDLLRSFFPALYVSKKLDASSAIGLNFSRKIQRPNFRQLMPGIQANDKQNIQYGNPALEPEFVNLAELNYNKMFGANNWLSTIYLSNETNTLKPLSRPSLTDPSVLLTSFVNGKNEWMYGLDNTLKLAFGKRLELMFSANVFNFSVKVDTFTHKGWAASGKANLTYKLPADISVQINSGYEGNRPMPQGDRKGIYYADFAVKKSFFHNAANLTFSINDLFNSRKDIMTLSLPTYEQETMRRRDTRFYKLSLQIPFGKADGAMFKKMKEAKKQDGQDLPDFGN